LILAWLYNAFIDVRTYTEGLHREADSANAKATSKT